MKKWIVSITIISVLLLGILTYGQCIADVPDVDNINTFVETDQNDLYVAQSGNETDCIYKMDSLGKVSQIISTSHTDVIKGMKLDALTYGDALYGFYEAGDTYSLVQFDENLAIERIISTDDFTGDKVGEMTMIDQVIYVTLFSEKNAIATVYSLDLSDEKAQFQSVLESKAPENRHYVETCYDGSQITARYDNGQDDRSDKEQDKLPVEPELMGKLLVSLYMNESSVVIYFLVCFSLLMIVILLILILGKSRSYGLQKFASMETILVLVLAGSMAINYMTTENTLKTDKMQYAKYQADSLMSDLTYYNKLDTGDISFCDSDNYQKTYETLFSFVKLRNLESFVEDVAIVSLENGTFVEEVSLNGYYGKNVQRIGSEELTTLLENTVENADSTEEYIRYKGKEYGAWVVTWPDTIAQSKLLLVIVPLDELVLLSRDYLLQLCVYGSILWLMGTLLLIIVTFLEFRSVRKLSKTMEAVCQGKQSTFSKPRVMNWDLERMWNSLYEIFKNRERLFYSKNVMFRAFYRFAPKNIEKILGKDSIADVKIGDSIKMTGVVGKVAMTGITDPSMESYMTSMNHNFDTICKYQTDYEGVILASGSNLTSMTVLFDDRVSNAIQFGIDTMVSLEESGALEKQNTLLFLHEGTIVYGVAGTEEQAFPYVISREFDEMQEYIPILRDMGTRMVVTEKVYENMPDMVSSRYIGYIQLKGLNKNVKLYEILDAYSVKMKSQWLKNVEAFQRGLNLYYKNDFYLARNTFTEVVKNCPGDQIAKWYLFTCEHMLNTSVDDTTDFKYGLFSQ
ncbi:MAG: hypothetical protein PHE02_14680 [Lachnospiraceae bacterium]|nr:hypothetical protein [Lachnospiraceae bacterium]